jgi:hypothetical protein
MVTLSKQTDNEIYEGNKSAKEVSKTFLMADVAKVW